MVWHIGNTTVRTPYRLREALIALQGTEFNGNLYGHENELALANMLHNSGIVDVQRIEEQGRADVSDVGRKWRSALSQLGFITHKVRDELLVAAAAQIPELSGRAFEITPNGYRLIRSEPVTAQQECFLRSLLAYRIPSPIEKRYRSAPFNPLKFVIDIILQLPEAEAYLSYAEFTLFVQTSAPDDGIENVIQQIITYRQRRSENEGQLKAFYREELNAAVLRQDPQVNPTKIQTKAETIHTYTDLTFRYLKATGLFRNRGHGIVLNPGKIEVANIIHTMQEEQLSDIDYLVNLWNGASLPTDEPTTAAQVIVNLEQQIVSRGQTLIELPPGEDVAIRRHILEERLLQLEEIEYYRNQANQTGEILQWIDILIEGRTASATLPSGETIRVPRGEAPAYFEWIIWRAFLAINSLVNNPWDARRFQIDQDFLPVSTAPGNGPDMIFEFDDTIIVVEVTLTSSSRQEAAEGETVRRHVARYAESQGATGKQVYGLFMAISIDSNTAHTFKTGDWYLPDDNKLDLHIVPMTLADFKKLFIYGESRLNVMPTVIQDVLLKCRAKANQDAPTWKRTISTIIDQQAARL